jgi:membrane glycosyltransferase
VFVILGLLTWRQTGPGFESVAVPVALATLAVLLGPWAIGTWDTLADRDRRRVHGGAPRLLPGTLLGIVLGALIAPIMMLHHTRIVASILMGRSVGWLAQRRRAESQLGDVLRAELPATLLGAVAATFAYVEGGPWLWLAPVWVPWLLAVPIHWAVSSASLGQLARRSGLLLISSETEPEPLLQHIDELRALTRSDTSARFRDLVLDPVLLAAHVSNLPEEPAPASRKKLDLLRARALQEGPLSLSPGDWRLLAADRESMQQLHREAWRHWPVESWDVGSEAPLLPPETPDAPPLTQGSPAAARADREARGQ